MREQCVLIKNSKPCRPCTRCPNKEKDATCCDIWVVDVAEGEFTNVRKMNLKKDETVSVGHPCLTPDGKMLIFASI